MTDLEVGIMAFDFDKVADRDRVLDMSSWAIHGHCLNLKVCQPNQSVGSDDSNVGSDTWSQFGDA